MKKIFLNNERLAYEIVDKIRRLKIYLYVKKIIDSLLAEQVNFYFVGGVVRDIIISIIENKKIEQIQDIDIVVETDRFSYVVEKIKKINFNVDNLDIKLHPEFLTINIIIPQQKYNIYRIDVSIPRKEKYKHSGALPEVSIGNIYDDLYRRDFTINAVALRYNSKNKTYSIFDPLNGIQDIIDKKIKVMHPKSFIDDPTRLIRAIRFAAKLKFGIENNTEEYIKEAVKKNVLKQISTTRLINEFINILSKGENFYLVKKMFLEYDIVKFYNFVSNVIKTFLNNSYKLSKIQKEILKSVSANERFYIILLFLLEKTCGKLEVMDKTKINKFKDMLVALNIPRGVRSQIYYMAELLIGIRTNGNIPKWGKVYCKIFKRKIPKLKFTPKELIKYGTPKEKITDAIKLVAKNNKLAKNKILKLLKKKQFIS